MAATTAGSIKAVIEAGGLSLPAYMDAPPRKRLDDGTLGEITVAPPYAIIHQDITNGGRNKSQTGPDGARWVREDVDVHVYQVRADERYDLIENLVDLLEDDETEYPPIVNKKRDGSVLSKPVHRVEVTGRNRIPPADTSLVVMHKVSLLVVRGF